MPGIFTVLILLGGFYSFSIPVIYDNLLLSIFLLYTSFFFLILSTWKYWSFKEEHFKQVALSLSIDEILNLTYSKSPKVQIQGIKALTCRGLYSSVFIVQLIKLSESQNYKVREKAQETLKVIESRHARRKSSELKPGLLLNINEVHNYKVNSELNPVATQSEIFANITNRSAYSSISFIGSVKRSEPNEKVIEYGSATTMQEIKEEKTLRNYALLKDWKKQFPLKFELNLVELKSGKKLQATGYKAVPNTYLAFWTFSFSRKTLDLLSPDLMPKIIISGKTRDGFEISNISSPNTKVDLEEKNYQIVVNTIKEDTVTVVFTVNCEQKRVPENLRSFANHKIMLEFQSSFYDLEFAFDEIRNVVELHTYLTKEGSEYLSITELINPTDFTIDVFSYSVDAVLNGQVIENITEFQGKEELNPFENKIVQKKAYDLEWENVTFESEVQCEIQKEKNKTTKLIFSF